MSKLRKKIAEETPPLSPDEAIVRLEYFCAYRERSTSEVHEKMQELGITDPNLIAELFLSLEGHGFLDEARFARSFASGKMRINHWGRVKIRGELRSRRIEESLIEQAIAELDESEYQQIFERLKTSKMRELKGKPEWEQRKKVTSYLWRCGFEWEMIMENLG